MRLPFLRQVLSTFIARKRKPGVSLRRQSYRLTLETLEDRLTPSTLTVDPTKGMYHTIQSAVNVAKAGDTIVVDAGTYTEQVTIPAGLNNLTLTTADCRPDATIQSPGFTVNGTSDIDAAYVVRISGAHGVTINDFNINGDAGNTTEYGIKVDMGATANITNNNITNIVGPTSTGGVGGGAGIAVGESNANTSGQATLVNNTVTGYGKVGIVVDGTGSLATVAFNDVVGLSASATFSQNGIQVSAGANATVCSNSVAGNTLDPDSAAGILVFQSGSSTTIKNNWTYGNEYGIFVFSSNNVNVADNIAINSHNDGIQLQGTNNSSVTNNISASNGGDGISVYGSVDGQPSSAVNNVVSCNFIYGNAGNGVTVQDTTGTQVLTNVIVDNRGNGVSLDDTSGGSVKLNFIDQDNHSAAIAMTSSSTKISNNVIVC
jgi:parallel beta-helix repeat protein